MSLRLRLAVALNQTACRLVAADHAAHRPTSDGRLPAREVIRRTEAEARDAAALAERVSRARHPSNWRRPPAGPPPPEPGRVIPLRPDAARPFRHTRKQTS